MFLFDPDDIRTSEIRAIEELGIPGITLMENAGRASADLISLRFPGSRRVAVLCGPGKNGGDGFVVARHLLRRSCNVLVLLSHCIEKISGDSLANLKVIQKMGLGAVCSYDLSDEELDVLLSGQDLIVDALLGTGSKGPLRGEIRRLVSAIKDKAPVVSIDIPTGVDPSSGMVEGIAVMASLTIALLARKIGPEVMPGRAFRGDIEVVDIGVPAHLLISGNYSNYLLEPDDVAKMLPERNFAIHKGDRGTVLVVGGSLRYSGAPVLSALGALRAGCGGVVVVAPSNTISASSNYPEMIFTEGAVEEGLLSPETWDLVLDKWGGRFDSVVIGPGLDRGEPSLQLFRRIYDEWEGPLCVDGDALFALRQLSGCLSPRDKTVITPHEGEAANLLSVKRGSVSEARIKSALELAGLYGTTILKGAASIVSNGTGIRIVPFAVPAISVPGSGDVLSGVVGAFLGMGMSCMDSASAGAYLHALAGIELEKEIGQDGIIATGIANTLPRAISLVRPFK